MSWSLNIDTSGVSSHALSRDEVEQFLIRAYVRLIFTPMDSSGLRTAVVAQFGLLEVRLIEFSRAYLSESEPLFQIEICLRATSTPVGNRRFFSLDEEELSEIVDFIMQANRFREEYH